MISAQQRIGLIAAAAVAALIAITFAVVWLSRAPPAPEPLTIAVATNFIGVPL